MERARAPLDAKPAYAEGIGMTPRFVVQKDAGVGVNAHGVVQVLATNEVVECVGTRLGAVG